MQIESKNLESALVLSLVPLEGGAQQEQASQPQTAEISGVEFLAALPVDRELAHKERAVSKRSGLQSFTF